MDGSITLKDISATNSNDRYCLGAWGLRQLARKCVPYSDLGSMASALGYRRHYNVVVTSI